MPDIEYDFGKFDSRGYLEDYYSEFNFVAGCLMHFYNDAYEGVNGGKMLEIGGGPTVYQLMAASRRVDSILFTDFSEGNRREVEQFRANGADAFKWDDWLRFQLFLEGGNMSAESIEALRRRVAGRITGIVPCDLKLERPVTTDEKFDVVSVNFCPESITDDEGRFQTYLKKCFSYLKKGGLLVLCLLRNSDYYEVNGLNFPAFRVDEGYMVGFLGREGFSGIQMRAILYNGDEENEGNIMLRAIKL